MSANIFYYCLNQKSEETVWPLLFENCDFCFVHPIFRYWFLVTFGDEVTKIWKYYTIFVYILQDRKNQIENRATKVTKIPKYGMNETLNNILVDPARTHSRHRKFWQGVSLTYIKWDL